MSNIVGLKLITGEEVIATKTDSGLYSKPRVLRMIDEPGRGKQVGLAAYIIMNPDADVPINSALIVSEFSVPAAVEKAYLETVTKIVLTEGR